MESCWWQGLLDTALCDKASSTNKTDHHHINEIVLKVALSTITITFLTLRLLMAPLACSSFVFTIHNVFLLYTYYPVFCGIASNRKSIPAPLVAPVVLLFYDTGTLYYSMTHVLCTILLHRYFVLYYDTGILDYIMTPVFCNILWDMYFRTILWHSYFVLYSLWHRYNDYAHYQVC